MVPDRHEDSGQSSLGGRGKWEQRTLDGEATHDQVRVASYISKFNHHYSLQTAVPKRHRIPIRTRCF